MNFSSDGNPAPARPRVVVVGAGFGGLRAARALRHAPVDVVLLDRTNYHLFQPLLYQVAAGALTPAEIAQPVRAILGDQRNLEFRMATVTGVDLDRRRVSLPDGELPYDYLVLAPGGETNFFGNPSLTEHGFGLKTLHDALTIRNHLLWQFEQATQVQDPQLCRELLTFVIAGGGPTGVECAGALSELVRLALVRDYPWLEQADVEIQLLEATGELLPGLPPRLQQFTTRMLTRKHVHVRFNAAVESYDGARVRLANGEQIPTRTLIWAAGIRAVAWLSGLGVKLARQGRIVVTPALQIPEHPEVFVIGDAAYLEQAGRPLPMVAPVAIQQAETAAENIQRLLRGEAVQPFTYHDKGTLATIGRNAAVAHLGRFAFVGFLAWVLWLAVHIVQLIGFRNRVVVLINWAWDYLFYDRPVRLIAGSQVPEPAPEQERTP